ncbi:alpha/beta hydrolase [Bradyrhizobium sp. NDS-1]|uniref:alpha/beta fold hydrolase n=1 Tax=Bradyrhizobium sp. NDS-1 TaxID=3080014 RepID=UPI00293E4CD3|nr:alpha/beta hydrolase [Bradyrhizobium sp. NDS-1]WOH77183.1 alpha/beta hydrolase [Bradyrhizobium sp. NDS-1]
MDTRVRHRRVQIGSVDTFYREAGPERAPVVLLPHGYPCSSYEFRNLMPRLADNASWLDQFVTELKIERFVIYLHDFGSPVGARLAIMRPERVVAQIIQNGDIPYEDALGPKYADIEKSWSLPDEELRAAMRAAVTEDNFRDEFLNHVRSDLVGLIAPDLWQLHWSLMTERRKDAAADVLFGLKANRQWFAEHRRYLQQHKPPTLIVWGPQDHYMPEQSARAYLRDLPDAELHLLDGGHWLLETNLDEVVSLTRSFLERIES